MKDRYADSALKQNLSQRDVRYPDAPQSVKKVICVRFSEKHLQEEALVEFRRPQAAK